MLPAHRASLIEKQRPPGGGPLDRVVPARVFSVVGKRAVLNSRQTVAQLTAPFPGGLRRPDQAAELVTSLSRDSRAAPVQRGRALAGGVAIKRNNEIVAALGVGGSPGGAKDDQMRLVLND